MRRVECPLERVSRREDGAPHHYFFGYYDKCPWDATGRYILAMRVSFMNRPPTPDDVAVIGVVDTKKGNRWHPLAETVQLAWLALPPYSRRWPMVLI